MTDIQDGITESESYSPDWRAIRVAAAVIVAAILAVVGVVLWLM